MYFNAQNNSHISVYIHALYKFCMNVFCFFFPNYSVNANSSHFCFAFRDYELNRTKISNFCFHEFFCCGSNTLIHFVSEAFFQRRDGQFSLNSGN